MKTGNATKKLARHNQRKKSNRKARKHNDRDYDKDLKAKAIADGKLITWHRFQSTDPDMSFADAEARFYASVFADYINACNAKAKARGQLKSRYKDAETMLNSDKQGAEETIIYLGDMNNQLEPEVFEAIAKEYIEFMERNYPQYKILDYAIHNDENGAIHLQERHVFIATDKDGHTYPNQTKALEKMSFKRPNSSKSATRWNNPKQAFDAQVREDMAKICAKYGINIAPPAEDSKHKDRDLDTYIAKERQKQIEKLEELQDELADFDADDAQILAMKRVIEDMGLEDSVEEVKSRIEANRADTTAYPVPDRYVDTAPVSPHDAPEV